VPIAPLPDSPQHPDGPEAHPRRPLDERLEDHRIDPGGFFRRKGLEGLDGGKSRHLVAGRGEEPVKGGNPSERGGPDRVAVIGTVEGDETASTRLA
jgi:hypothetical protein